MLIQKAQAIWRFEFGEFGVSALPAWVSLPLVSQYIRITETRITRITETREDG